MLRLSKTENYGLDHSFLNLPASTDMWMNLGVWRGLNSNLDYKEACLTAAKMLGDAVGLKVGDFVLDVGFGCGDQDFFFLDTYGVEKIIGYGNSMVQVGQARRKCAKRREERFEPRVGSAPGLPPADGTYNVVLSLDSAYHYNTREKFVTESYNMLMEGGRFGTIDLFLSENMTASKWIIAALFSKIIGIPWANLYNKREYEKKLKQAGFARFHSESIDSNAFSHLPGFIEAQIGRYRAILSPGLIRKYSSIAKGMKFLAKFEIFELRLFVAYKSE